MGFRIRHVAHARALIRSRSNAAGGRAYFIPTSVPNAVALLLQISDRDLEILDGPVDQLYFLHKNKGGVDFYWIVNNSAEPRTNLLRLHATGRPERWDAQSGKRQGIFYQTEGEHTVVRLALGGWDASLHCLRSFRACAAAATP